MCVSPVDSSQAVSLKVLSETAFQRMLKRVKHREKKPKFTRASERCHTAIVNAGFDSKCNGQKIFKNLFISHDINTMTKGP